MTAFARIIVQPLGEVSHALLEQVTRAPRETYPTPVELATPRAPVEQAPTTRPAGAA